MRGCSQDTVVVFNSQKTLSVQIRCGLYSGNSCIVIFPPKCDGWPCPKSGPAITSRDELWARGWSDLWCVAYMMFQDSRCQPGSVRGCCPLNAHFKYINVKVHSKGYINIEQWQHRGGAEGGRREVERLGSGGEVAQLTFPVCCDPWQLAPFILIGSNLGMLAERLKRPPQSSYL